uniref:(E)-beta-ocimene synthase, chloroplastic-like n=1 Tax=Erigeron canadensis TaxID=72917 RepID=UPI001CB8C471|nr:(E)-beta-ocimene synthase, chloroplastic-like [Erigeron canadensis]
MALTLCHITSNPKSFFDLSIQKNNFTQILRQKSSQHYAIKCEAKNNAMQTTNYKQSVWSHEFINGLDTNVSMNWNEKMAKVEKLEDDVMKMIMDYENDGSSTLTLLLELVDNIERLGLGYRFQTNIMRALNKVASLNDQHDLRLEEDNLHAVSLKFRLLRQHGYSVCEDFLERFKDIDGGLRGFLGKADVKSLLSLYEASYLALEGETSLHEAKLMATEILLKLNRLENEAMYDQVNHALETPLYRRMLRLEARWYIDAYGKQEDANKLLLELAILDFNMVQTTHKKDLQEVSKWWKDIGLARKLSFIRDRIMECFFGSVGGTFEPQYSSCRLGITKVFALINTIDDIFDHYGSLDELKVFNSAVKRWDINAIEAMPEYLQVGFLALFNTVNEIGYDTLIAQGRNPIPILAKVWGDLFEAFMVEARWSGSNHMPTLAEYLDNAWRSVAGMVTLTHGYFLINQEVNKDATKSLDKCHDLYKWSSMIARLYNDLAASSDEIEKGVNAISCYMNDQSVSEEVAREHIESLVDKAWMKMIEARISCSGELADPVIETAINQARVVQCIYQYGDKVKSPDATTKAGILSMLIQPITIRK